ncbi:unnamed protein product [Rotaria magnacalcarata]
MRSFEINKKEFCDLFYQNLLSKIYFVSARRRAFEICFLQAITENDEKQIKRLRLIVKQCLFESLQATIPIDFIYPTLQALTTDPEKREKYLVTQCEYVLEHFENILRTLEKYLVTQCEYVLEHFENILRTLEKYQDRLYN